jgi:hypothetical protein
MLSIIRRNVIMPGVIRLNVIMLNVVEQMVGWYNLYC